MEAGGARSPDCVSHRGRGGGGKGDKNNAISAPQIPPVSGRLLKTRDHGKRCKSVNAVYDTGRMLTVAIIGFGSGRRKSFRRPHISQDFINSSCRGSHEYSVPYHGSTCSIDKASGGHSLERFVKDRMRRWSEALLYPPFPLPKNTHNSTNPALGAAALDTSPFSEKNGGNFERHSSVRIEKHAIHGVDCS